MKLLPVIIASVTPEIKAGAKSLLDDLKARAAATPNPFDDALVEILDELLADGPDTDTL